MTTSLNSLTPISLESLRREAGALLVMFADIVGGTPVSLTDVASAHPEQAPAPLAMRPIPASRRNHAGFSLERRGLFQSCWH